MHYTKSDMAELDRGRQPHAHREIRREGRVSSSGASQKFYTEMLVASAHVSPRCGWVGRTVI